jgi:hypothetical protein
MKVFLSQGRRKLVSQCFMRCGGSISHMTDSEDLKILQVQRVLGIHLHLGKGYQQHNER